jgi:hypothetical protein
MGAYATYSEARSSYRILVGMPEGKRIFGRPRCKWEDDIKWNLKEIS